METLKIKQIVPDANQPRKFFDVARLASLRESIKKHGIVNPIIVKKGQGDTYTIIDGERRFRAASELGLREVPIVVREVQDEVTEMIEQFHVQEQHENWTAGEKAQVLADLAEKMKVSFPVVCEKLNIDVTTARAYIAYSKLSDKTRFAHENINISFAEAINGLKTLAKRLKEQNLEEGFTLTDARKLEKNIVTMIKDGTITNRKGFTQIKDTITMNPKLIDKFLEGPQDVSDMFVKSKAKSAGSLRSSTSFGRYYSGHIDAYLKHPDAQPTKEDINVAKNVIVHAQKFLSFVGDLED